MSNNRDRNEGRFSRRRIVPILIKFLGWTAMVLVWWLILMFIVDLPAEYKLRHATDGLRREYKVMSERYDSISMVLDNVIRRDENVFRKLFESNPYQLDAGDEDERISLHEELMDMNNDQLMELFEQRRTKIEEKATAINRAFEDYQYALDADVLGINNIPAIQPINNRQLTLLAAGKKPLINPFHRAMREHHGVDYLIPEGTTVFATADGIVKSLSEKNTSHGKAITISHGNGYETSYSHLLDIRVKRGQRVKRGDIIALSGNSGLSFAPHLHYEVIYRDTRVDPVHYFFLELSPEEYQRIIRIALSSMQSFD